jgi:hypothetical protein
MSRLTSVQVESAGSVGDRKRIIGIHLHDNQPGLEVRWSGRSPPRPRHVS